MAARHDLAAGADPYPAAFETAILTWRRTHCSIAARMLGERRGTSGSDGVRYLEQARDIPVFASACPFGHGAPAAPTAALARA